MLNARNRCSAFTARQWQELEHQALIFKYMTCGMPIPPDLLYPIRRGCDSIPISPTLPRLFPQHPTGWGCFQMGFGRKAADPEPGRCRRTDGKKWRCSKEAYPDSKYCERHMHRGRNRSRKPVELTSTPTPSTSSPTPPSLSPSFSSSSSLTSPSSSHIPTQTPHPYLYPHSSSSITPAISLSNQNSTSHFNLDSSSYSSADKDYRYLHGLKEDIDEHAFFSEASGSLRSIPDSNIDSSWRSMQRNSSVLPSSYYSQQQQQQQHCFVLGTDFKSGSRAVKVERDDEPQQPLRLFFDEWPQPPKNRDSWLDLEDRSDRAASSTTQLSISIPVASSLFPSANSRSRNGGLISLVCCVLDFDIFFPHYNNCLDVSEANLLRLRLGVFGFSPSFSSSSSLTSPSSSHIPTQTPHPYLYPHSSSSITPAISLSNQNSTSHFNLDSSSYSSADKDYRYLHGLKEDIDEHAFFSEASGSLRSIPDSNIDSSWRSMQRNSSVLPSSYYSQQQQQQQHCFVLGTDFKSGSRAVKVERDDEPQQPLRLFFDEWPQPPKNRDSWLDLEDRSDRAASSTTQLSISIPVASSLFPSANSRSRNDD
ncbi:growth-regulating factor 1-like [Magnolia sinica]|uniref:growth-regulating factor 1-like n=1 Tax=Magnolia sinica TaxID=86752 RepID=UPI00265A4904|nr:growth-regulating factor 1-like [Magnolia sinica]